MDKHLFVAASIFVLTLAGYALFPGHTWLQSDTQIYAPILERYRDPTLFTREMLAQHPHVSFTIYDEVTLALRSLTGLGLREALALQQFVLRALGIFGVYLIATSLQLSTRMALLVAATFSLGATLGGATVLTFEYEPVPRGFAIPLLFLAIGFVAHGRDLAAGVAASLAFLYQAPAVCPFWAIYFLLSLLPTRPAVMSRRILGLLPMLFAVVLMFFLSRLQTGVAEPQPFFGQIDASLEKLQRMRAPYNWVSLWQGFWFWHYGFLWAVSLAAFIRIRKHVFQDLRFFLAGMPLIGMLSLPASYLLLEKLKWVLIPQVQPMRAVLFVTALAGILAAVAGIKAAEARRFPESILWLAVTFAIPVQSRVLQVLAPNLAEPLIRRRVAILLLLAGGAALTAWAESRRRQWSAAAWAGLILLPFFLIPGYGKVTNYTNEDSPELAQLEHWARSSTSKDAVFLFPDAGRRLYPGIFRATALRAVYVDWKGGGQVNFFPKLGEEWWRRWQLTMAPKSRHSNLDYYSHLRIDYVVVDTDNRFPAETPVFVNPTFVVYRTD